MRIATHIYNLLVLLFTALILTLTGCEDKLLDNGTGEHEQIGFCARLTETTRGMSGHMNIPYINIVEEEWMLNGNEQKKNTRANVLNSLDGVNVGMYVYQYNNINSQSGVVSNHHYRFINKEELQTADPGSPVLWNTVVQDSLRVYGYAPYNNDNVTLTNSNNNTTITYKVDSDVFKQTDLIATEVKKVSGEYNQNIPLTFKHILTGIRFKAGFSCKVKSLKIEKVYSKGEYTIGEIWRNRSEIADFALPIASEGKVCEQNEYITDGEYILMMVPQILPNDACVVMEYEGATSGTPSGTIRASLKGLKWEEGTLITYVINQQAEKKYVYFDLNAGNVVIKTKSYSGYVFVGGNAVKVSKTFSSIQEQANYHYYIYQSTNSNKNQTGWESAVETGTCRIPSYKPVEVNGEFWSSYITNNSSVESVIEKWDTEANITSDKNNVTVPTTATGVVRATGRTSTANYISVLGEACEGAAATISTTDSTICTITIDNIYSTHMVRSTGRTTGGITYKPTTDKSRLTINMIGDNRVGSIHYYSGKVASALLNNNRLILQGSGSLTVATSDFYKGMSAQSSNVAAYQGDKITGYFSNYWCSAIGGNDGIEGNSIGIFINSGTVFAGTTQAENCTAIGAGGNDKGVITISGGNVTAVATTTGTAIGGGIGFSSTGGVGNVYIKGGNVFAYNHINEWEIPSAAIGSAGSWQERGGNGEVEISGGYVYAQTALGTAIGGGSSETREGGNATVKISGNSYVIAKSISGIDKYTNTEYAAGAGIGGGTGGTGKTQSGKEAYGGSAFITIEGNPTIRTGSIGGGKTNNPKGTIGYAQITVKGGDIMAQFVMAAGADKSKDTEFNMSGGTISNSFVNDKEYYHVSDYGGAVYMEDGKFTMTGGTIQNCTSEAGGAIYIKKGDNSNKTPEFLMKGGTIKKCISETHGGALYIEDGNVTISGGIISGNLARKGNGGGIYIAAGNLSMDGNSEISDNSALQRENKLLGNGGAIYATSTESDVNIDIKSGYIINNTCDANGGGLCVNMNENLSTANVTVGIEGSTDITNPDISGNKSVLYGGGLYAIGENAIIRIYSGQIMYNYVSNYVPNENVTNMLGTVILKGGNVTHQKVTFDSNADDATIDGQKTYVQNIVTATNSSLVPPDNSLVQRNFYDFQGWNSRPDGNGMTYTAGQLMNITEDITLYAQWKEQ